MSPVRWTLTTLAMAGTAWLLAELGPTAEQARQALTAPQTLVDAGGPDALLVTVAAAAGWLCWAWGALGLALTVLSALPGMAGRGAGLLLLVVLPAGARRAAAVAVGLSLATGGPVLLGAAGVSAAPVTTVVATAGAVSTASAVDWPVELVPGIPPDWPAAPAGPSPAPGPANTGGEHVVLRGECLWEIAADWLARQRPGTPADDADVAAAVHDWWQANTSAIGPDPDLILPGQVLRPPSSPTLPWSPP